LGLKEFAEGFDSGTVLSFEAVTAVLEEEEDINRTFVLELILSTGKWKMAGDHAIEKI
jgi:hypothetical protein